MSDPIERAARAMCRASGYDPDSLAVRSGHAMRKGPRDTILIDAPNLVPLWRMFYLDAHAALASFASERE